MRASSPSLIASAHWTGLTILILATSLFMSGRPSVTGFMLLCWNRLCNLSPRPLSSVSLEKKSSRFNSFRPPSPLLSFSFVAPAPFFPLDRRCRPTVPMCIRNWLLCSHNLAGNYQRKREREKKSFQLVHVAPLLPSLIPQICPLLQPPCYY